MIDLYELFKSVELITDAKINEFRSTSDKTIEATIISIDRQKYGEYTVQYESTKLIVHSADMSYGLGDEVYVGIPAGSYNSAYIIAKKIKSEQVSNHTNPFQDFVEMDSKNNTTVISTTNMFDNPSTVLLFDSAYTTLEKYSHLGLSVTQNSAVGDLSRFKNVQYGLSLHIITAAQLGVTGEKINRSHVFNFDSSEFIGNPFNFVNDVTQYKVLDIDSINNIEQIKIYGYCFLDDDAKKYLDTTQDFVHNFLHFISVKLSLGYHMSAINEEGLYLYTDGPLSYGAVIDDHQKKKLLLRWVYKQNNKLVVVTQKNFDTLFPDNASLTWQHKTNDQWVDLTPPNKGFIFDVGPLDLYRPIEEYRAVVLYANFDSDAPQEFGSNILTFENKNTKRSNLIIDNSMMLSADQNDYSMYYGPDGIILDPGQTKRPQCIKCSAGLEAEIKNIDEVVSVDIIWKIPHKTMIKPYGFTKDTAENMSQYAEYNADYQQFRKTIVTSSQVKDLSTLLNTEFYFQIRDFYSPDYGNNKIECEIQVVRATDTGLQILQKDSQSCALSFAKSGLCKTDKVIQLTMYNERNEPVRAICPGETLIIKAIVYDCNGSPLTLTEPIKWSWWCAAGNSKEDADWDEYTKSWSHAKAFLSARTTGENTCEIVASSWPQGEEKIVNSNGTLTKGLCYILQASYIQGNSTIVGQLPIGINFAPNQVNYVCGPTQVLYGVEGGNPTYYNVKYQAYNFSNIALPNWSWAGYVHTREQGLTSAEEGYYDGYPKIHSNDDEEYMLCPNTTF